MNKAILLLSILFSACRYGADAAAALDTTLTCQTLDLDGVTQDVCVTYAMYTPSPAALENGTTVYLGPYSYTFDFWQGLDNGTDTSTLDNPEDFAVDLDITVSWENDGTCSIQVNGDDCSSCSMCEDSDNMADVTLSADCTNVDGGLSVDCKPAFIFYPFPAEAATGGITDGGEDHGEDHGSGTGTDSNAADTSGSWGVAVAASFASSAAVLVIATII